MVGVSLGKARFQDSEGHALGGVGKGDPGSAVADDQAAFRAAEFQSDVSEPGLQRCERRGVGQGLRKNLAREREHGRHSRSLLAAQLAGATSDGEARARLARQEVQAACDFLKAELALLRAQRAFDPFVVATRLPHPVRPRVDERDHAVEMRVVLVAVRDDDGLVFGKFEVPQRSVGDAYQQVAPRRVGRRKADFKVVDRLANDVVQACIAGHLVGRFAYGGGGDVASFPPRDAFHFGVGGAEFEVAREVGKARLTPRVRDHERCARRCRCTSRAVSRTR